MKKWIQNEIPPLLRCSRNDDHLHEIPHFANAAFGMTRVAEGKSSDDVVRDSSLRFAAFGMTRRWACGKMRRRQMHCYSTATVRRRRFFSPAERPSFRTERSGVRKLVPYGAPPSFRRSEATEESHPNIFSYNLNTLSL